MKIVFFLLSWLSLGFADVPACHNGVVTFDPPLNRGSPTWYPNIFTNNPPIFPANYSCVYQINVPEQWFAQIQLTVVGSQLSVPVVQVIDQLGNIEGINNSSQEYFYFIAKGGKIKLSTQTTQPNFGFSVVWKPSTGRDPISIDVPQSYHQPTPFQFYGNRHIFINANTKVSATIIPPVSNYKLQYLRGVVYFDGSDPDASKCLGTGYQLLNSNSQFVSSGPSMNVLILSDSGSYPTLFFQDYADMQGIKSFQGTRYGGDFTMDASKGMTAYQIYNYKDFGFLLKNVTGSGKVDVYVGTVAADKSNLIASYDLSINNQNSFPQLFLGTFTTFVMYNGNAAISGYQSNSCPVNVGFGRKAIISSAQYGSPVFSQDMKQHVYAPDAGKFRYTVSFADLVKFSTLKVIGRDSNGQQIYIANYNSTNAPKLNTYYQFYGKELYVAYDSNENKGFLMQYTVEKSVSGIQLFIVCASMLMFYFV